MDSKRLANGPMRMLRPAQMSTLKVSELFAGTLAARLITRDNGHE